jgi:hypothetical protein
MQQNLATSPGAARSNRTSQCRIFQRIVAIVDKRARLPAMWIVLALSRSDLAEETICLVVDPGGEEEFVNLRP